MILRPLAVVFCLVLGPAGLAAQTAPVPQVVEQAGVPDRIADLSDTLRMAEVIDVMRQEGLDYGNTLNDELLGGAGGARWAETVQRIYDPDVMRQRFEVALGQQLAGAEEDLTAIQSFFGSAQGQSALKLEVEARRSLLDDATEEAAKAAWDDMLARDDARVEMIRRFATANDLVESNVMGALNSNFAFYRGMAESNAFPQEMTEEQMLQDVWDQEPDIRRETEEWLFPFLALAYQPLPDADLEAYIAFSETAAGKRMNAALFAAFDAVFVQISHDLGYAAAKQMQGEDI